MIIIMHFIIIKSFSYKQMLTLLEENQWFAMEKIISKYERQWHGSFI